MKEQYFKEDNETKDGLYLNEMFNPSAAKEANYHDNDIAPSITMGFNLDKNKNTFIRYRSTINSVFFIEKYIENYIGEVKCSIQVKNTIFNFKDFFKENKNEILTHYENNDELKELIILEENCIIRIYTSEFEFGDYKYNLQIFLKDEKLKDEKFNFLKKFFKKEEKKEKGSINIMVKKGANLNLVPISNPKDVDLSNYPSNFEEIHNQIIEELKKDKGIFLFYGDPGTGKTSYVKSLPLYAKNKKFIFIPPAFGEILSSPEFLTFMIEHKNSVLIIEDAESVLKTRTEGRNNAVSNLLNITDGILQELLNIQVICTLNCNIDDIDEAIKRPGRLLIEHEFIKLSIEESNNKLKELYPDDNLLTNENLSIAEIYNYKQLDKFEKKEKNLIGFKNK